MNEPILRDITSAGRLSSPGTMNQSLASLISKRLVDPEVAKGRSPDVDELNGLIAKGPEGVASMGGRRPNRG